MSGTTSPLPDLVTLEELAAWLQAGHAPTVEVQSIDQGYYLVRLHHGQGVSQLVDDQRRARRFTGTQWVSRALLPLGITHGVLTWAEVTDEMIGLPQATTDPASVLAHGTRVAFQTR